MCTGTAYAAIIHPLVTRCWRCAPYFGREGAMTRFYELPSQERLA